jgi:hypothetical protein
VTAFLDRLAGLGFRTLQVRHLDTRVVEDHFVTAHEMEVAVHPLSSMRKTTAVPLALPRRK